MRKFDHTPSLPSVHKWRDQGAAPRTPRERGHWRLAPVPYRQPRSRDRALSPGHPRPPPKSDHAKRTRPGSGPAPCRGASRALGACGASARTQNKPPKRNTHNAGVTPASQGPPQERPQACRAQNACAPEGAGAPMHERPPRQDSAETGCRPSAPSVEHERGRPCSTANPKTATQTAPTAAGSQCSMCVAH